MLFYDRYFLSTTNLVASLILVCGHERLLIVRTGKLDWPKTDFKLTTGKSRMGMVNFCLVFFCEYYK